MTPDFSRFILMDGVCRTMKVQKSDFSSLQLERVDFGGIFVLSRNWCACRGLHGLIRSAEFWARVKADP